MQKQVPPHRRDKDPAGSYDSQIEPIRARIDFSFYNMKTCSEHVCRRENPHTEEIRALQ